MPNMSETPSKMGELERRRTISTTNTCLSLNPRQITFCQPPYGIN